MPRTLSRWIYTLLTLLLVTACGREAETGPSIDEVLVFDDASRADTFLQTHSQFEVYSDVAVKAAHKDDSPYLASRSEARTPALLISHSGTKAMLRLQHASMVLLGAFCNFDAVSSVLRSQKKDVLLIPAALYGVERIESRLRKLRTDFLTEYRILPDELLWYDTTGKPCRTSLVIEPLPAGRSFDEENLRALKIRDPEAWQAAVVGTDVFRQYWRRPSRWTKEGNPVDSSPCQWAQFVYNESIVHDPRNPSDVRNFFNPVAACLAHLLPLVAQAFDGATRHPGELGIDHRKALTDVAIRWFGTLPHTLVSLASSISMSDEQRRTLYSAIRDVRRDLDRLELLARPNGPAGIRQEPYGADAAAGSGR